jgi:hypothetical protein
MNKIGEWLRFIAACLLVPFMIALMVIILPLAIYDTFKERKKYRTFVKNKELDFKKFQEEYK